MTIFELVKEKLEGKIVKVDSRTAKRVVSVDIEYDGEGDEAVYLEFEGSNYRYRLALETNFEIVDE